MTENDPIGNERSVKPTIGSQFGVMLPCEPEQFGEFISGLLGKPQTIEKSIHGIFELERQDVLNTFHLLDQRIRQQNDATLIQFTVRIIYNDDSSVLLNSLSDFEHYSEIRPIASIGAVLSWTYIIKFKNKRVPEKQEVNLSFRSENEDDEVGDGSLIVDDGIVVRKSRSWYGSGIFLRINHTERTWGVDIESLLTGHVKSLFKNPSKSEKFIYQNSAEIGFTAGTIFFLGAIIGVVITSTRFIESYLAKVHALSDEAANSAVALATKLDFLVEVISTGVWPRFIFSVIVFLVISLLLSITLGTWIGTKAGNRPISYVLLSKSATERRNKSLAKIHRDWYMFAISVVVSIAINVVSNVIYAKYFGAISQIPS